MPGQTVRKTPYASIVCYVLAFLSLTGGVWIIQDDALPTDGAPLWTYLFGSVIAAAVLWTLGTIAEDVRATRLKVLPEDARKD